MNGPTAASSFGFDATPSYLEQVAALRQSARAAPPPGTPSEPTPSFEAVDADTATISPAARAALEAEQRLASEDRDDQQRDGGLGAGSEPDDGEQQMIDELEARDREVRAHEAAHQAAAGDLAVGGASYTYQTGPDGKRYAIGGEVQIRLSEGRTPEETLRNMERAIRAANSPDSPSGPDRAVAAQAARIAAEARRERAEEGQRSDDPANDRTGRPRGVDIVV